MTAAEDHGHLLCVVPDTVLIHKSSPSQVAIRAYRQGTGKYVRKLQGFDKRQMGRPPFVQRMPHWLVTTL